MDWGNAILHEPFEVKRGMVHIPDRPEAGISRNDDAVKR